MAKTEICMNPTHSNQSLRLDSRRRKWHLPFVASVGVLALADIARAGTVVDWLAFTVGADRRHFSYANDAGANVAQAEIALTNGTLFPLSPAAGLLQSPFWTAPLDYDDSVLSDDTVPTTKIQIVPAAGQAKFKLTLSGADLSGMVFSLGQLLSSAGAGTGGIGIVAKTLGGTDVAVNFLGTDAWDDGIRFYTQPLIWGPGSVLSSAPGAVGESAFAFFGIPKNAGVITSLTFDVPSAANAGSGDALEFAFGVPVNSAIPEPGTWLTGCAMLFACGVGRTNPKK